MRFTRLDNAFDVCKQHLDATATRGTEAESYLVGYLLTTVYAEYETSIRKILIARIGRVAALDADVHRFIHCRVESRTGRIEIGDLGKILAGFGKPCKNQFDAEITNLPPHLAWDSILRNRTAVAHNDGSATMTFVELEKAYHDSKGILRAFARATGLSVADIGRL